MDRFLLLLVVLVGTLALGGCNNRSRGGGTTDPRCPDRLMTGNSCDESELGLSCSGTVSCPCGDRATSCMCGGSGGSFRFTCVDSCSSCPARDSGIDGARCAALYDRVQGSACPYPADFFTREEYVAQCEMAAVSDACRAELESLVSCALTADIVCEDFGDGNRYPTFPSCGELSSMCAGG